MSDHPNPTGREAAGRLDRPQARERGSASLIGLAMCAFVVIATLVTADVGALASARARAQTAADLAALAAVTPHLGDVSVRTGDGPGADLVGLGSPAERASAVAASNAAEVLACDCGPLEATVTVAVRARLIPLGTSVRVRAYAKAALPSSVVPSAAHHRRRGGQARSDAANGTPDTASSRRRQARSPGSIGARRRRAPELPVGPVEEAAAGGRFR